MSRPSLRGTGCPMTRSASTLLSIEERSATAPDLSSYRRRVSFRRGVKLEEIAVWIEEVKAAAARAVDRRRAVSSDAPILHFVDREIEVLAADDERVMGGAVLDEPVAVERLRPLEKHDHVVAGSQVRAVQVVAHVVAVELGDRHAEHLGIKLDRPLHVIYGDADVVESLRLDHG